MSEIIETTGEIIEETPIDDTTEKESVIENSENTEEESKEIDLGNNMKLEEINSDEVIDNAIDLGETYADEVMNKIKKEEPVEPDEEVTIDNATDSEIQKAINNTIVDNPLGNITTGPEFDPTYDQTPDNNSTERDVVICEHIVPISCSIIKDVKIDDEEEAKTVANISFLCKDHNDTLFMINRIVNLKNEEEILSYECLPFADYDTDYMTRKIENYWLSNSLERFTTNLQFYVTEDYSSVYTYGISSKDATRRKIMLSKEGFMGLLYLDKYPLSDEDDNEHDLQLSILNMSKPLTKDADFFRVNKVELMGLSDATYREIPKTFVDKIKNKFSKEELVSTNIAVKLRLFSYANPDISLQLLAPFDVGVVFDQEKFKGDTIETLQKDYLKEGDQYVANLTVFNAKLYGVDKTFSIIRGINKNKEAKLFLIDEIAIKEIRELIDNY